jgi:hypothetical protein
MPMKKYKPEQIVTLLRQNELETKMKQRIVSRKERPDKAGAGVSHLALIYRQKWKSQMRSNLV